MFGPSQGYLTNREGWPIATLQFFFMPSSTIHLVKLQTSTGTSVCGFKWLPPAFSLLPILFIILNVTQFILLF